MAGYDESTYGQRIAETYDTRPEIPTDTDETVAFLAEVAGRGPVLELGIGTGRIALPLAGRGLQVSGIDASPAMVAKLREKPGGSRIPVTPGNFADVAGRPVRPGVRSIQHLLWAAVAGRPGQMLCQRGGTT
jgi:SAM-dependent methyltransferase